MPSHEEQVITKIINKVDRNSKVLEVGCGLGNKIELLALLGFHDITGVEINEYMVQTNRKKGLNVVTPEEFTKTESKEGFDLLLLSHIVEHFQYQDLKEFLETYFPYIKPGGLVLIITPVLQQDFYDDFDHVKPYGLRGLLQVFGDQSEQVQFYADQRLQLLDIHYVKLSYALKYFRALTLRTPLYYLPRLINRLLHLLYRLSLRTFGRTTSWVGLFHLVKPD